MINSKFISFNKHCIWFADKLRNPNFFLYKGTIKNKDIGIIIFKIDKLFYNADVSISLHPDFKKKKLSSLLLKKSIKKFYSEYIYNINLIARIKKKNTPSIKIFLKTEFNLIKKKKELLYFKRSAFLNNVRKKNNNIGVIIQARQSSKRLPNKVLKKINGFTLVELLLARLVRSKKINKIVVAIPKNKKNKKLFEHLKSLCVDTYRGSENNVLKRYYEAARENKIKTVIRITCDCPLLHSHQLDKIVQFFLKSNTDYVSNIKPATAPQGFSVEIFKFSALENSFINAKKKYQKEHVNYYIHENQKFSRSNFVSKNLNFSSKNFSVDTKKDFKLVSSVFKFFRPNIHFRIEDIAVNIKKI